MQCPARRGGFTMVELMVVLIIVSIVAATIVPAFSGTFHGALLRATCRKLTAVLGLAGSLAITTGTTHRVRIDLGEGRFWIEAPASPRETKLVPVTNVPGSAGGWDLRIRVEVRAPDDRETGEPAPPPEPSSGEKKALALVFRPDGTAQACELRLSDIEGFVMLLRVHPATGRLQVLDEGREEAP
jgi:type II secretion system protein H